ncbi:9773_t:CDS:2 [Acaulospora morrowiae]|uniref:9773_t:CDS:1 n=1 Tax=Acaulospora morrowiae TaxID=94023 RepID=A0A9N9FWE6_9GLOM|nr:9773_t:CDS:2 [Acaulospora morrowiae]
MGNKIIWKENFESNNRYVVTDSNSDDGLVLDFITYLEIIEKLNERVVDFDDIEIIKEIDVCELEGSESSGSKKRDYENDNNFNLKRQKISDVINTYDDDIFENLDIINQNNQSWEKETVPLTGIDQGDQSQEEETVLLTSVDQSNQSGEKETALLIGVDQSNQSQEDKTSLSTSANWNYQPWRKNPSRNLKLNKFFRVSKGKIVKDVQFHINKIKIREMKIGLIVRSITDCKNNFVDFVDVSDVNEKVIQLIFYYVMIIVIMAIISIA